MINYDALKGKSLKEQRLLLAGAVNWEIRKTSLAIDLLNMRKSTLYHPHAYSTGGGKMPDYPGFERIKAMLGKALMGAKYTTVSDTPILTDPANEMEEFFHTNMPKLDLAFLSIFKTIDLRNSTHDHWDILDSNLGISWSQRVPGGKTKIRTAVTESKFTVPHVEYSDGIGILDSWLRFQKWYNIDAIMDEFIAKYWDKMAAQHYGLFTSQSTGIDEAFDTDDATTANNAMGSIIRAVDGKGYGVGAEAEFTALTSPEKVGRLASMNQAQVGSALVTQGTSTPITVRISQIIGSNHVAKNDTGWYLLLPGLKNQRGDWDDLQIEQDRDITVSASNIVGRGAYNAAAADADQIRRVKFA